MEKETFILYTEQRDVFEALEDEEAGKLIKAIYEYVDTGQVQDLDKSLKIAFIPIQKALDRDINKWNEIKQKRSEAGKSGAEIKKQKQAKQANANFALSKQAKQAVNVNVNDNVNVNVNYKEKQVKESDSCVDGFQKIVDFYNENIGLITPYGVEILTDYAKEMPSDVIIYAMQISVEANKKTIQYIKAILNNWEKAGIKTLIQAKEESQKGKKPKGNFEQREYNNLDFLYKNLGDDNK